MGKLLTPAEAEIAYSMRANGHTIKHIADKLGCGRDIVRWCLMKKGGDPYLPDYSANAPRYEIAAATGMSGVRRTPRVFVGPLRVPEEVLLDREYRLSLPETQNTVVLGDPRPGDERWRSNHPTGKPQWLSPSQETN